jgi:hypothetical protein
VTGSTAKEPETKRPSVPDEPEALRIARQLLAEGRDESEAEAAIMRRFLRTEKDPVLVGTLRVILVEVEAQATVRARNRMADQVLASMNERIAHEQARPERWRALHPMAQVLLALAEHWPHSQQRRVFAAVAAKVTTDGKYEGRISEAFEPDLVR